jgi:hypothetical protein
VQYRKKPITIEAYQFFPGMLDHPGVRHIPAHEVNYSKKDADGKEIGRGIIHEAPDRYVCDTLEGQLYVTAGDWIIKGVKGEYYPCKPDIFAATYDQVEVGTVSFHPDSDVGRGRATAGLPLEVPLVADSWNEEKLTAFLQQCVVWGNMISDPKACTSKNFYIDAFQRITAIASDILLEHQKVKPYAVK